VCAILALALAGCARLDPSREASRTWSPDSIPEAYRHSVAALMWPGATRSFQVTPDGNLFNGVWEIRCEAASGADTASAPGRIAYEERWCPVVRWTRRSGAIEWDFEAVAAPAPESWWTSAGNAVARPIARRDQDADRERIQQAFTHYPESRLDSLLVRVRRPLERSPLDQSNLLVSLEIRARNTSSHPGHAALRLTCRPLADPPFIAPDSDLAVPWSTCWAKSGGRDSALGWCDGQLDSRTASMSADLEAGGDHRWHVLLPAYPVARNDLERWAARTHADYVGRVRSYWIAETNRGARFDLGDREVENAIRSSRVLLLAMRERRTTRWVPLGGPFHYRDVWLRDGARAMHALAISGYTRESRELASSFLDFQWPHGPFVSQAGQLDGTGQALWAFEQVLLRPAPAGDVSRYADAALRACRAVERQRAMGHTAAGDNSVAADFSRMLPATDPHDAEMVRAQLVGNDAWAIAGYRAAARLLRAAKREREADSIAALETRYRAAFERSLELTGRDDVPASWQNTGTDWGNLAVGYPCMTLPASDPHLLALAKRYWAPVGGPGPGWYRDPDSLHSYVAVDLGTWALLAGERGIADRVLDAALAWRSASGGAAEIFSRSTRDFGRNFPPHVTAAAALVTLIRNSLIFDDSDTLQLTLGARERWWHGSKVRRAPTRWGLIDLSFDHAGDTTEWRWTPVPVWTALTLPPDCEAGEALPAGIERGARQDVMLVPPGVSRVRLKVRPRALAVTRSPAIH
jgi:hypothetical protein